MDVANKTWSGQRLTCVLHPRSVQRFVSLPPALLPKRERNKKENRQEGKDPRKEVSEAVSEVTFSTSVLAWGPPRWTVSHGARNSCLFPTTSPAPRTQSGSTPSSKTQRVSRTRLHTHLHTRLRAPAAHVGRAELLRAQVTHTNLQTSPKGRNSWAPSGSRVPARPGPTFGNTRL